MALVFLTKPRQSLTIGQADPTLRPFQGLNGWLFIDGKDERILGRIEIKTHNVGGVARKLRVSGNAPTVAPFQFDALLAQNAPDLIGGNIGQLLGNHPPIPAPIARRGVSIKEFHHPFDCDFIIFGRLSIARRVLHHLLTVPSGMRKLLPISRPLQPSAALRIIWLLILSRCSTRCARLQPSNTLRSSTSSSIRPVTIGTS